MFIVTVGGLQASLRRSEMFLITRAEMRPGSLQRSCVEKRGRGVYKHFVPTGLG